MYIVDVTDPFPGPLHGFAWHSFGVPLTFYQPPGRVYSALKATQERMSVAHLDFFDGLEPWQDYGHAQSRQIWDGEASRIDQASLATCASDSGVPTQCKETESDGAIAFSLLRRMFTT
jgi:hypothetical protein